MAIAPKLGILWILCLGGTAFQSCANSSQPPQVRATPEVIEATPLPSPEPILLAAQPLPASNQIPWIKTQFLSQLQSSDLSSQGLWIQSDQQVLSHHRSDTPLSSASVTKIGTTLAALHELGADHRFQTLIGMEGTLVNGELQGNLIVQGGDDPFFVWEDGFAIAQLLESQGIQSITGDLLIVQPFVMNFETDEALAGALFKQALDSSLWPAEAQQQFETLPSSRKQPQISIAGEVKFIATSSPTTRWLVQHDSLPLVELLKRMNRFSNNPMADQIANHLGGGAKVAEIVRSLTQLPERDLQFINGSGLGVENRITAKGATLMFQTLANLLDSQGLSLGDVLTIVGQDEGILDSRSLPAGIAVKSGTLNTVSALAGVIPTQTQGLLWFTIFNTQGDVVGFRQQQESLLAAIGQQYGFNPNEARIKPTLNPAQLKTVTQPLLIP